MTLQPPPVTLASLSVAPPSLVGSNPATGTITLTNPAPTSGLEIELTSSDPARVSVPSTVVVPATSTQATFSIATALVSSSMQFTITASYGVTTKSAALTLLPPAGNYVASLSIVPQYLVGGQTATGTVSLATPSSVNGGSDVTLTSSDPSVIVPSRVTVKKNQSSETFSVTSSVVTAPKSVAITAAYGGAIQQTSVIVAPQNSIALASFTIAPLRVTGGSASAGTVTLNAPAPVGGAVITIAAQRRNMVSVPASITITEGVTSTTFAIGTDPIHGNRDRAVAIDATYNGITRTATLTIAPLSSASRTATQPPALCASATLAPCLPIMGIAAATTAIPPQHQYSLYSPELSLLAETQSTSASAPAIAYEYVWFAGVPLAQIETSSGATHYYFNDHLGTPILTTDSSGAIDWRVEREPYGKIILTRAGLNRHQPLAFPGQEEDQAADRSYNIHRWYRGGWGRYTQADPLGIIRGGGEIEHVFSYARSAPLLVVDPYGLDAITNDPGIQNCIYCIYDRGGYGNWNFEESLWVVCDPSGYKCVLWPATKRQGSSAKSTTSWNGPIPQNACGLIHTHPRKKKSDPSSNCKDCDVETATQIGMPVYTAHPDGIWKYDPQTQQTTKEHDNTFWNPLAKRCKGQVCKNLPK